MRIEVVLGTGVGETTLSAFDNALVKAGVHNYNLIVLSSVIPKQSEVIRVVRYQASHNEWGHRLYIVKADVRSELIGNSIAAGLGWYQLEDGRGMFVEHDSIADNIEEVEMRVKNRIRKSLYDLCINRALLFNQDRMQMSLSSTEVKDKPACALVVAVYQSEDWKVEL
ncbi:MAG: pyruvoyl-dependent arginine decarboxylase [Candidatus Daviesbacteria bacterium]|nr:pyruvoyl-dependent arginine decarboxylase [Candidatus Daviesbacteria bacterium]